MPQPFPESQGTTRPEPSSTRAAGQADGQVDSQVANQVDRQAAVRAAPSGRVAIIMGSQSDWPVMRHASETLDALGVVHAVRIVSAHRTPERLYGFARSAKAEGYQVIIAGAGGAAHLPGMTAAMTPLPVFGVPVPGSALGGHDALFSIVQMPGGVPVGTLAIGKPGAINAALLAAAVLALNDAALADRLDAGRAANTAAVDEAPHDVAPSGDLEGAASGDGVAGSDARAESGRLAPGANGSGLAG